MKLLVIFGILINCIATMQIYNDKNKTHRLEIENMKNFLNSEVDVQNLSDEEIKTIWNQRQEELKDHMENTDDHFKRIKSLTDSLNDYLEKIQVMQENQEEENEMIHSTAYQDLLDLQYTVEDYTDARDFTLYLKGYSTLTKLMNDENCKMRVKEEALLTFASSVRHDKDLLKEITDHSDIVDSITSLIEKNSLEKEPKLFQRIIFCMGSVMRYNSKMQQNMIDKKVPIDLLVNIMLNINKESPDLMKNYERKTVYLLNDIYNEPNNHIVPAALTTRICDQLILFNKEEYLNSPELLLPIYQYCNRPLL